jgi:serine phosphatase RsbU (regulator of sigma subunit)
LQSAGNSLAKIDRLLERLVISRPRGSLAVLLWSLMLAATAGCGWLVALTGPTDPIELFWAPVVAACFLFRRRGLWLVPVALIFRLLGGHWLRLSLPVSVERVVAELVEWLALAAFTLITLDKYESARRAHSRIKRDVAMAGTLQRALLPREPLEVGRMHVEGIIRQTQQVGGDFYYYRPFQKKYTMFCLGDIMGKGIPASMVMASLMGFVFEWGKTSTSPARILAELNRHLIRLWQEDTTWFTTLFYAVYDEEEQVLTWASAGHHGGGILLRANGETTLISGDGIPVGIFEEAEWQEEQIHLQPGDRLVLFTDGLTEARDPDGEMYGLERLARLLHHQHTLPTRALLAHIEESVLAHSGGNLKDDMAILVAEVKPA